MDLVVLDWNVNGWHTLKDDQLRLMRSLNPDVLLLQEVTPRSFDAMVEAGYCNAATSRHLLPEGHVGAAKGSRVRFWAAMFVREDWPLRNVRLLAGVPSPERTVVARVQVPTPFVAASLAIPPGVTWFEKKREQGMTVARWMDRRRLPVVVGIDRNGPKTEREDGSVELWRHDAQELFEAGRLRNVRDVQEADRHAKVSYVRGRGEWTTPCRYDAIYASRSFEILDVQYMHEEAIQAGSDHGLVLARLRLE